MIKKLLLASLIVSCYSFVVAQETSSEKTYKHDIGFNTTFLFDGILNSDAGPFTLMYKINRSEQKAIRLGLSTSFAINNSHDDAANSSYSDNSGANIFLTIGKEFRHQVNKWVWYGGGDLIPHYSSNKTESYSNGDKYSTNKTSSLGLGLRPFLGIRYNINNRLYVAAEAGVSINYSHDSFYTKNEYTNTVTNDVTGNSVSLSTGSATGIYLFYSF